MNFWNSHDIEVMDLRCRVTGLTQQFKDKFSGNPDNYDASLDRFLKKNLNKRCEIIMKSSIIMTAASLYKNRDTI